LPLDGIMSSRACYVSNVVATTIGRCSDEWSPLVWAPSSFTLEVER